MPQVRIRARAYPAAMRAAPALLLAAACASPAVTGYPRDFHYVTKREVHGAMERMAKATYTLNELLRDEGAISEEQRRTVVALLGEIDEAARSLDSAAVTNHPMLDRNLAGFRATVARAKDAAAREPPNYYLAGAVTHSCLACHGTGSK